MSLATGLASAFALITIFLDHGVTGSSLSVLGSTCPLADVSGISTFLIPAATPTGQINSMLIKYNRTSKLPIFSVALHDELNAVKTITRATVAEPFGPASPTCPSMALPGGQINCTGGISMTDAQKVKASPRYTWDRGHLTPANPMRFSEDALNKTFLCVNIAPQDSWTNQIPWMTLEVKSEVKLRETNGYIMTGLCSANNTVDGPTTYKGYIIPKCYWKLICYKDKVTKQPKVVGFIGDNSLVNFSDSVAQAAKNATTLLPRSPLEILNVLSNVGVVAQGWAEAQEHLTIGRSVPLTDLPTAAECTGVQAIDTATLTEWQNYIKA